MLAVTAQSVAAARHQLVINVIDVRNAVSVVKSNKRYHFKLYGLSIAIYSTNDN